MADASSFVDAIRELSSRLQVEPHSPVRLNHVADRVDQLGRRLYGLGWVREREIGRCLMAAVSELGLARELPEGGREDSVRQAVLHLQAAIEHAGQGLRPPD